MKKKKKSFSLMDFFKFDVVKLVVIISVVFLFIFSIAIFSMTKRPSDLWVYYLLVTTELFFLTGSVSGVHVGRFTAMCSLIIQVIYLYLVTCVLAWLIQRKAIHPSKQRIWILSIIAVCWFIIVPCILTFVLSG